MSLLKLREQGIIMKTQYIGKQITRLLLSISAVVLVACGGGGAGGGSSGGGTTNPFFAELTSNEGLKLFSSGELGTHAPESWTDTATANSNGTYVLSVATKSLISGVWTAQAPASQSQYYYLTTGGSWDLMNSITSVVMTPNANGTISWSDPSFGAITATAVGVDLSGANINTGKDYSLALPTSTVTVKVGKTAPLDANGNSVAAPGVIAVNATYPSGAKEWLLNGIRLAQDSYEIYGTYYAARTPGGNITALNSPSQFASFATGNPICVQGYRLAYLGNITGNSARFNIYAASGSTCTPIVSGSILATVDLTFAVVRGQPIVQTSLCTLPLPNPFLEVYPSVSKTAFLASIGGQTYLGYKRPVNYALDETSTANKYGMKNKIAMDAVMNAAGLPTF